MLFRVILWPPSPTLLLPLPSFMPLVFLFTFSNIVDNSLGLMLAHKTGSHPVRFGNYSLETLSSKT